jgi:hypothetical protein
MVELPDASLSHESVGNRPSRPAKGDTGGFDKGYSDDKTFCQDSAEKRKIIAFSTR